MRIFPYVGTYSIDRACHPVWMPARRRQVRAAAGRQAGQQDRRPAGRVALAAGSCQHVALVVLLNTFCQGSTAKSTRMRAYAGGREGTATGGGKM